jgi:capsular exopolysaccharide synthesis family protein
MPERPPEEDRRPPVSPALTVQRFAGEPPRDDGPDDALHLTALLDVLRRRAPVVVGSVLAALAVMTYLAFSEPSSYRATAVLRLSDQRAALPGGPASPESPQESPSVNPLVAQIQLLHGRGVIGRVVDAHGFQLQVMTPDVPRELFRGLAVDSGAVGDTLRLRFAADTVTARFTTGEARVPYGQILEAGGARFTVDSAPDADDAVLVIHTRDEAIDLLLAGLTVESRPKTDIVDVSYTAGTPHLAVRTVNALAQAFRSVYVEAAQLQSRRRRLFLEEQLRQTDALLAKAQRRLSNFRSGQELYSSRDRIVAQQTDLIGLEVRREELAADRRMYQSFLSDLRAAPEGERRAVLRSLVSSPGIAANPVVAQLHQQLVQYQTAYDTLTIGQWSSAATNPDALRLRELIASTETSLVGAVQSHVASLDARIAALRDLHARSAATIRALPSSEAEEVRLARQVETFLKISDQLQEEYQRARVAEAVESGVVQIVDLATRAELVAEMVAVKLGVAGIVGLLLGLGIVFVLEQRDTAIHRRHEAEAALCVPVLAVIPRAGEVPIAGRRAPLLRLLPGSAGASDVPTTPTVPVSSASAPSIAASIAAVEAFRVLRTNLMFSRESSTTRTLVVTSATSGAGKTVTAANLAVTCARDGKRVLLIDGDLRRPRLHQVFALARDPGLVQVMLGYVRTPEVIRRTSVDGLSVLTSGTAPTIPSWELLRGGEMRVLLDDFRERFDLIIIDAPPVLPVADAAILAALADATLLVVRAGRTARAAAQLALRQLASVGGRVVGVVLNDPSGETSRYPDSFFSYYSDYLVADDANGRTPEHQPALR